MKSGDSVTDKTAVWEATMEGEELEKAGRRKKMSAEGFFVLRTLTLPGSNHYFSFLR